MGEACLLILGLAQCRLGHHRVRTRAAILFSPRLGPGNPSSAVLLSKVWGQIYAFLPDRPWVREAYRGEPPWRVHAHWLEIGWALRRERWGQGYASEIGAADLAYAFDVLRGRCRRVVHGASQPAVAGSDGTHRHALRRRDTTAAERSRARTRTTTPFAVCLMLAGERSPLTFG